MLKKEVNLYHHYLPWIYMLKQSYTHGWPQIYTFIYEKYTSLWVKFGFKTIILAHVLFMLSEHVVDQKLLWNSEKTAFNFSLWETVTKHVLECLKVLEEWYVMLKNYK